MLTQGLIEFDAWAESVGLDNCLAFTLALNVVARHMRNATDSDIDRILGELKSHIARARREHGLNCQCESHGIPLREALRREAEQSY